MGLCPPTRAFALKRSLLRWCGAEVGDNVRIVSSARFMLTGGLSVGDDTWIGHEVMIVGGDADVRIGARVDIAPRVTIATGTHAIGETCDRAAGPGRSHPVTIEDGVWIGAGATILGGVRVGAMSIVGACALVNRDVAPSNRVGGVPARPLARRGAP